MPEDSGQSDVAETGGGLMTGNRGWIIVFAVVILEAVFFSILLKLKSDKAPADTTQEASLASQTPDDFIKDKIILDKLNYSIPMPSGQPMTLAMDLTLVIGKTEKEIRDNVQLQPTDWAEFMKVLESMKPWIKDQLNRAVNKMSSSELSTDRGQQLIRDTVRERVNSKLNTFKFQLSNDKIEKDRVTDVWITNWYFN